jgi:D-3-phosphoglycerate dehydrogenase
MQVLIIDPFRDTFLENMRQLPLQLAYCPDANREEVKSRLSTAEILILNSKVKLDRELIDAAPRLRRVIRAGVGMDHIDLAYLAEKGIRANNCAGSNADAVAEQTVGMLIALRHHLRRADQEVRQFVWKREENRGHEIKGKTVGIIGYGNTGSQVALRLSSFGCRILAYDKYKSGFGNAYVEEVQMPRIFAESDILSLHIPLTEETHELVNTDYLNRFSKPIYLLNLARGPIVYLPALLTAMDQQNVLAAALDVLPNEKLNKLNAEEKALYEDLFQRENALLSPHIGGWTVESKQNIDDMILAMVQEELG